VYERKPLVDDDLKSEGAAQMAPTLRTISPGISLDDEAIACRFDLVSYPGDGFTGDRDKLWAELQSVQDRSGPSTARARSNADVKMVV
jgi:hypothetical protein